MRTGRNWPQTVPHMRRKWEPGSERQPCNTRVACYCVSSSHRILLESAMREMSHRNETCSVKSLCTSLWDENSHCGNWRHVFCMTSNRCNLRLVTSRTKSAARSQSHFHKTCEKCLSVVQQLLQNKTEVESLCHRVQLFFFSHFYLRMISKQCWFCFIVAEHLLNWAKFLE